MENMKDTTNSSRPEDLSGSGIYDNADSYFGGNFSANINVPLDNDAATVPDGPYEIDGLDSSQQLPEYNDSQYPETGNNKKDGGKEGSKFIFLLQKFTLYETKTHFYIVGSNARETRFRILEIDLAKSQETLSIKEIGGAYNRLEVMELLGNLEDQTKTSGGLTKRLTAWGIMGFIRFTEGYYILMITKRSCVALLGGHYVYHIDATQLIPLAYSGTYRKPDRRSEETRYLTTFQNLDLSKTFYFSYTYDITHTLQHNMIHEKKKAQNFNDRRTLNGYNEMFVWNNALLKPVVSTFENAFRWYLPIIHGFIDQAKISVSGRNIHVTIIARRSHYFAGARFLKRGVNDQGRVANEVETEQIVAEINTTSFHDPREGLFNSKRYTSYVQHRGSIPLFWSQEVNNMSPKPPIELNAPDPYFAAAALHFDDMFARYGPKIKVLNLIKTREKNPRETKLLVKFNECIRYLNQFLPEENRICYTSWDMSRASKSRDQDVIEFLEKYADETLQMTEFFHNGKNSKDMRVQKGICRTNCIDCLDRTNAAQFVIGKKALGYQLHALNVISDVNIDYDSDAVNMLTEMFHDHGDTIALQYGGSHLVNTMETYRKINQWSSHSRDMIESIRRFYSNSFVDSQRQDAINLFLGNFVWEKGQPMLWDLTTDYYLHNRLIVKSLHNRRSYVKWWTPINLEPVLVRVMKAVDEVTPVIYPYDSTINELIVQATLLPYRGFFDNYWNEYYKPRLLSSFHNLFAFNMNSTLRYVPPGSLEETKKLGPFKSRKAPNAHRLGKQLKDGKKHDRIYNEKQSYLSGDSATATPQGSSTDLTRRLKLSRSSGTIGSFFNKNPGIRFLTDPLRNIGTGGHIDEDVPEMSNSLGSLESNTRDPFNGSASHTPIPLEDDYNDRPIEDALQAIQTPIVPDLTKKMYSLYANYQVEFTIMSSEPVTVDHPDYATYDRAISPELALQKEIPQADSTLYEDAYKLCTMGPPQTLDVPEDSTSLPWSDTDLDSYDSDYYYGQTAKVYKPKAGELEIGSTAQVVSEENIKMYNDWINS
ncbi:similar to Saccharomyces cerevisiae YNL325C FIG4 Phosphatidylinositol 3,5-bisphosphate (PtdIns[3,5]P) phosphatase [Geotrichum candidum]|uniref:Similar to Saccharomyces cerevisiae YNL325C FIG4 Phosphatidylinositol 3,5-bisphosphate (PtdIns[3,5]P) phosphatase n=1 Tax=Geotrichum candidum TaxID=1173061 RepID=A0A0J9X7D1_GEOCN|nr:similar to Saccharomyces cerevisiae YNL325C FIG4 Phosphatidylinositol 3,5-bisphosphate (PtdIns[3,5]P) phosphatase [Geotrichum candidum]